MKIFVKDISERKEFDRYGETFKLYEYVEEHDKYIYQRFKKGVLTGWEVVCPVVHENQDGSIVKRYPYSNEFGKYGWYLPPRTTREELQTYVEFCI